MISQPRIVAVIPAHNEQEIIAQTIMDLLVQTQPVFILVVADNCNDRTVEIVRKLQFQHSQIRLLETKENKARKAGAINQALCRLASNIDAVLLMDADTRIAPDAVERAWETLSSDSNLAAVCSKAGVLPYEGRNVSAWLLHRLQRLEYAMFDSQRVETLNGIKVVHGMAAIHKWEALRQAGFYDEGNLVEDYDLTLRYKEDSWQVTVELAMQAWTDVPTDWRNWWKQRLRWNRGGVDTLKKHGWNQATRWDISQHVWVNALLLLQWFFLAAFIVSLVVYHGAILMHGVVLLGILFGLADSIYRLKYLERATPIDWLVRLVILPELIYGYIRTINLYQAYLLFFFQKNQSW